MPKRKPIDVSIPEGPGLPPGYRITQGPKGGYRLSMPNSGGSSYSNKNLQSLINLANQGYQNTLNPQTGPLPGVSSGTGGGGGRMAPSAENALNPAMPPPAATPPAPQPEPMFRVQGAPSQTPYIPRTGGPLLYTGEQPSAPTPPSPAPTPTAPPIPSTGSAPSGANPIGGPAGNNPYAGLPELPPLFSQQPNPYRPPGLPSYNFQGNTAPQMLGDVFGQATGGTINAYNTAANRLRERLDASTKAAQGAAQNQYLSRGLGASGLNQAAQFRAQQIGQGAYAQGLSDLSNQFEQQRQQGLQTALGAGSAVGQQGQAMNQLMQQELQNRRELAQQGYQFGSAQDVANRQFMDRLLLEFQGGREERSLRELLQGQQQSWQGGENAAQRQLQQLLAELAQQGENYRGSLGPGLTTPPTIIQLPGYGAGPPGSGISVPYPVPPSGPGIF